MGGHTQFGEYITLDEVVQAFKKERLTYEDYYHLHLKYAQITFDAERGSYRLAMRFTK